MLHAYRLEWSRRASYPVSVSSVWTRENVQQVVAVSRYHATSLVVQSTVSAAAGTFLTLGQHERDTQVGFKVMYVMAKYRTCAGLDCCPN